MSTPETSGPARTAGRPSGSTAPSPGRRSWWSAVPHHLGRARTSTVVLALLFVGLYTLYLYVRPTDPDAGRSPTPTVVQTPTAPVEPTATAVPTPPGPPPPLPGETGGETPAETTAPPPTPTGAEPTTPASTPAAPTATGAPGT